MLTEIKEAKDKVSHATTEPEQEHRVKSSTFVVVKFSPCWLSLDTFAGQIRKVLIPNW